MRSHGITGREWPLLLGMVLAGLLVIASMRVSSEAARSTSAPQQEVAAAREPNVASPLTTAGQPGAAAGAGEEVAPKASAAAATKKKEKASSKTAAADAPAADAPAADAPAADTPSAGGGGRSQSRADEPAASEPGRPPADSPHAPSRSDAPVAPMFAVNGNGGQVTASGITFSMSAPTHKPTVGQSWALKATAARGDKPLAGKVVVDAVYQGEVVAHMHSGRLLNGTYEHSFTWPKEAAGHPLTIKVSITAGGVSRAFLYDVVVRPAG